LPYQGPNWPHSNPGSANIFDRYYRKDQLKVKLVGGSDSKTIDTKAAAGDSPDIIDVYPPEQLRKYARKGIAVELNGYLKELQEEQGVDIRTWTWPARLDDLRLPNPDFDPETDHPLDRWKWYAVPNNMNVNMIWFNMSLYEQSANERGQEDMPPAPWLHWTWWDYAALAKAMHRRSPTSGNFMSFGAQRPGIELLYHQIGLSMRGISREEFAELSFEEKRARGLAFDDERLALNFPDLLPDDPGPEDLAKLRAEGLGELSWETCTTAYKPRDDGTHVMYPNRVALRRALQFSYDMEHTLEAVPSSVDAQQIAMTGGHHSSGSYGQFKSGVLAMFECGRWFLGQVRADATFDWRLYRIPRWVPYEEWARWTREGKGPGERDGAWGDAEPPTALRGYGNFMGGRMAFISKTAKDHGRADEAFKFLEYLMINPDFNRILLIEDGMGADMAFAKDYLSKVDPLFPEEAEKRPVEHEMGALDNLVPTPSWPYRNYESGRQKGVGSSLGAKMNGPEAKEADPDEDRRRWAPHADRVEYGAMERWFEEVGTSHERVAWELSDFFLEGLQEIEEDGLRAMGKRDRSLGPTWYSLAFLGGLIGFIVLVAWWTWRDKRVGTGRG